MYLDVPLRYPLCLLGSKSSILDGYPPAGTWWASVNCHCVFCHGPPMNSSLGTMPSYFGWL